MALSRRSFSRGGLAVALSAGSTARTAAQAPTVRVGLIQSMSGGLASYGQEGQPAFEHVVRQVNAAGGIKSLGGAKIELVLADDASNPSRTAAEARRLIIDEKVSLLGGTLITTQMLALAPVLDELKVPTLATWAGSSRSPYIYSIGIPYEDGYARNMAEFSVALRDRHGFPIKTAALLYTNYEGTKSPSELAGGFLKAKGIEVVGELALDLNGQDYTSALLRLRALKPDVVVCMLPMRNGLLMYQARYNLRYNDSIFVIGNSFGSDESVWADLPQEVANFNLTRNLFGMTAFSRATKQPSAQTLFRELSEQTKLRSVGQVAFMSAQSASIMHRALERAGSTGASAILDAFATLNLPSDDPAVFLAKPKGIAFGPDRMLTDNSQLFVQWSNQREQEVVYPDAFAGTRPRPRS